MLNVNELFLKTLLVKLLISHFYSACVGTDTIDTELKEKLTLSSRGKFRTHYIK